MATASRRVCARQRMHARQALRGDAAGRTLVELLVTLAISLVLLASALATVISVGTTSRYLDAAGRLADEGQMTLALLDSQLRMAGFSFPRMLAPPGIQASHHDGVGVHGCDHGFITTDISGSAAPGCVTSTSGPAAFGVLYEADEFNTWPSVGGLATDCAGSQIAARASALGGSYVLAENRYFIRVNPGSGNPALYCAGSGGTGFASQPLVDNVEDLTTLWGVAADGVDVSGMSMASPEVVRYMTSADLHASAPGDARRWSRVVSVRFCVLLRTPPGAADAASDHTDCHGVRVTPLDASLRRIRRAFSTTVFLRNRGFAL